MKKLRFRGDSDLPQVNKLRNGRNWNSRLADLDSAEPIKVATSHHHPPTRGWVGTPFLQVLIETQTPRLVTTDELGKLPRAQRYTVISCDGIVETPLGGVK